MDQCFSQQLAAYTLFLVQIKIDGEKLKRMNFLIS